MPAEPIPFVLPKPNHSKPNHSEPNHSEPNHSESNYRPVERTTRYELPLKKIPADFFADPDGDWDYETLVHAAGFDGAKGVAIGALAAEFRGHPAGSAVVTLNSRSRPYVAIVECRALATTSAPEERVA